MNTYIKGSQPKISFQFRNVDTGSLVDPTTVSFSWKIGRNGAVTTYIFGVGTNIVQDGVGQYHVRLLASAVGIYYTAAFGTGTGQAAEERPFEVVSQFP